MSLYEECIIRSISGNILDACEWLLLVDFFRGIDGCLGIVKRDMSSKAG